MSSLLKGYDHDADLLGFFYTHSRCLERSWMVELPPSQNAVAAVLARAAPPDPFEVSSIDVDPVWCVFLTPLLIGS